jgi:hypothetical protein
MKTLLMVLVLALPALNAFAQGQLIFANNTATKITNCVTRQAVANGTRVGLYVGDVGDPVGSLSLVAVAITPGPTAGLFAGGIVTLPGRSQGSVIAFQVRAWLASTVYPSYEAAISGALGCDGTVLIGLSVVSRIVLTEPPAAPNSIANSGLNPIIIGNLGCVPEPSAVALGLVGLMVAALFRSRK